jgi:hypothetical protein
MERFPSPWDRGLRVASALLALVLVAIGGGLLALGLRLAGPEPEVLWPFLVGPIVCAAVLAGCWALGPRGFSLRPGELVVERPLLPVRIALRSVRAVDLLPGDALAGALRVAGNAGLFGYVGRYWSRALGDFRLYATRRDRLVRVEAGETVYLLSPEPPERFADALLARAPLARRAPGAPRSGRGPRLAAWAVAAALGLGLLVFAGVAAAVWGLAPCRALVTADAVRIERNWAPPRDIRLASVRSAERLHPAHCGRWRKVNGTSGLFGVAYGTFQSRALGRFRLYAWRPEGCVLLETGEGRVVLTPDDPDAFVAAVRAALPG